MNRQRSLSAAKAAAWPDIHLREPCDRIQAEDGNRGSKTNLRATLADRGVPARLDQRTLRPAAVPLPRPLESSHGNDLGLSKLQPDQMVRPKADTASNASVGSFRRRQKPCGHERCRKHEAPQLNPRPSSRSHESQFLHGFLSPICLSTSCCRLIAASRGSAGTPWSLTSASTHPG